MTTQPSSGPHAFRRRAGLIATLAIAMSTQFACSSDDPVISGQFVGSPVSGLDYRSDTQAGTTDAAGTYQYKDLEKVSFSIGALQLGSATAAPKLHAQGITAGAASAADPAVNNKLILLQTLDADGDLNNGIQITPEIRAIVSARAGSINFNQSTTAFRTSLTELMAALNAAPVFTDTDPRPRSVRTAAAALEHFQRATAERNTVTVASGQLSGWGATAGTWQYLGIPYAKPPLGELRWKAPQAPAAWSGVRDAIAWGDQAPQNPAYQAFGEGGMSEDCLYLNVTAPRNASNLPVMVWFHGGGFVILTGNTKAFNNPASLPTKGVVLVTVNHRLGPFGYLAHPLLSAESGYGASGNYGQMDQIAALNWVKANIAKFGGDAGNVTIFGESGGGGKVLSLMNSPLAKGLFHKGISQSGQAEMANEILNVPPLASAEKVGASLFGRLGVSTLAQARAKPWTDIVNAEIAYYPNGDYKDAYGPNLDGYYATKTMLDSIKSGLPNDVPLLQGSNNGDMPGLIVGMLEQAPLRATYNKAPQYVYKFTKVPTGWASKGILSYHGGELVYVFNYQPSLASHFLLGLVMDPATGQRLAVGDLNGNGVTGTAGDAADVLASAAWDAGDSAVAETMMTIWTNFAKTGNPSTANFSWPAYTPAGDAYVQIGTTLEKKTGLANAFK